jgi:tungstate transport system ATP-binding protein
MNDAATAPLLALAGASVRYGSVAALRGVDVEIRRGEFVALVGSNGAGKTTLLHALHGLLPIAGTRRVAGAGVAQAMVFQRPFMLRLSVLNNVRIALWLARVPRAERAERAREALARAGLADRAERSARTLSGGQQQRLALARAWAVQPDVLFLDEPTSNLDPAAKKEIEAMLAAFAADGMTLVMSTHNLGQAKRLATRVILVDAGEIRADLPSARFFEEHADLALRRRAAALAESEELS